MFQNKLNLLKEKLTEESLRIQQHHEATTKQVMDAMLPAIKSIQAKLEQMDKQPLAETAELSVSIRELNAAITTLNRLQEDPGNVDLMNQLLFEIHECRRTLDTMDKVLTKNLLDRAIGETRTKNRRVGRRVKCRHRVAVPNYYR